METRKTKGNAMIYLKWWKGRTYNQEYSTKQDSHSDLIEKPKAFQTSKLRKFSTTKPALQYRLKELLLAEKARERKDIQKINPKTIRKMVRESYILTITINVNGLNAPTKRHRLAGWMKTCECMHFYLTMSFCMTPQIVCNYCILLS